MPIIEDVRNGRVGVEDLDLNVTVSGMAITVRAGSFHNQKNPYSLAVDQVFTAAASIYERYVEGYLVKVRATGATDLLVDEIVLDGIDVPFNFGDGTYEVLQRLFDIRIPPNTDDLAPLNLRVLKITPT